ncbi:MAG: DUF393 domain-containing protein [Alsobacter sp.]
MAMTTASPASPPSQDPGQTALMVYFDGSCPLCSAEIGHYSRQRGAECLRFVDASVPGADAGPGLGIEQAMARFHVRMPDGRLLSGAPAFVAIWNRLPGWRWPARLARLPGVTRALDAAYRAFLPVRPLMSKIASRLGAKPVRNGQN